MSLEGISLKRVRRTWEPTTKSWDDRALKTPWEDVDPSLDKSTVFALKNVFFFSHATPIQYLAIKSFSSNGQSAIIEAPTGSGKTLAFLIPLMERVVLSARKYAMKHERPPLNRDVVGIILSPSRTLADQTFIVAKQLAARYPFRIQFLLCDGVAEKAEGVVRRLLNGSRGAGSFIVTTPHDLKTLLPLFQTTELERFKKDETCATDPKQNVDDQKKHSVPGEDEKVRLRAAAGDHFLLIVDEADLTLNSASTRDIISETLEMVEAAPPASQVVDAPTPPCPKASKKSAKGKRASATTTPHNAPLAVDFALVGATVTTSPFVHEYAEDLSAKCATKLDVVSDSRENDYLLQLENRYLACEAQSFLSVLVQLINTHASKKHFIFFNSVQTLLFVHRLFTQLSEGARPVLFVKNIYSMYDGMSEVTRMDQYNKFLTHSCGETTKQTASEPATAKNPHFQSGLKRAGKPTMGSGAILLCTDIAAFGIDVRDVDYVYHFEPPSTVESYVHRVGRVARMGLRGSSMLLLPCFAENSRMTEAPERKTTSNRFNTATNTRATTTDLQSGRIDDSALGTEGKQYIDSLAARLKIDPFKIPPHAPISAMLRNIIHEDAKLLKLAQKAAIAACQCEKEGRCWFQPKLALNCFLLD